MVEHRAVLPDEVFRFLSPGGEQQTMIDATVGQGGHSSKFLEAFEAITVYGIDADPWMLETAKKRLEPFSDRFFPLQGWFDQVLPDLRRKLQSRSSGGADIILFDLGLSMAHLEKNERGFSYRESADLDMRLNTEDETTAAEIVNSYSQRELADLIYRYGEERYSRRIAAAIVAERQKESVRDSAALAAIVRRAVPPAYRRGRIHPATRTFQALRIAVNDELRRIESVLPVAADTLVPGGRLGFISFHSLEDRIVKHGFRRLVQVPVDAAGRKIGEPSFRLLTKKPIEAGEEEKESNPASRSAKLRVLERVDFDSSSSDRPCLEGGAA
ncbi:MAG: 16S rRNA (cytosine(1402)-N(4))-methyltransferase RsmH [Spirochaetales bacterium]|nr:16S rRNA (cytosine(1402)-N(4))-methyltransferase RsmH [Spirochaetales bacterium]MCF7937634.1 16S rRNA (cytosine(1402)-N(4))-methyltransferase RsmH [Spirochaetales bacterium]